MTRHPEFELRRCGREGDHRLILSGELDVSTAPELESSLARLCVDGTHDVAIDMRAVVFIDSAGLRSLLVAKDICAQHGVELSVVPPDSPPQRRLFELSGLRRLLPRRAADATCGSD